jgi:hypothetical protein
MAFFSAVGTGLAALMEFLKQGNYFLTWGLYREAKFI